VVAAAAATGAAASDQAGATEAVGSRAEGPVFRRSLEDKRAAALGAVWGAKASLPDRSVPDGFHPTNTTGLTEITWTVSEPGFNLTLNSTTYLSIKVGL